MKKAILALGLMLFAMATTAGAVEIKDMKKNDWAYESVKKLVEKGYLAMYDDGTFRGDQPVSRTALAAALAKLLDQIERGELSMSKGDAAEVKKLSDTFKKEISDYDNRMGALEQRLKDIESGKVVIQQDISKAIVEFRDKFDAVIADQDKMKQDIITINQELAKANEQIAKERKDRKKSTTTLWIGVLVAGIAGAASN